jgi:two-component system sensor histidine kinase DegS
LFDVDSAKARDELGSLKEASTTTFQKVRDFIVELRPMMLDDLGLVPTLNRYVESIKEQSNVDIRLNIMGNEQRFESYLEVMLFRSIQELISTAIMYSRANQIKILLDIAGSVIEVHVEDNGKGIAPELLQEREGMGLKIIKERVEMLGGEFNIQSSQGEGSRVQYSVPITKTFG